MTRFTVVVSVLIFAGCFGPEATQETSQALCSVGQGIKSTGKVPEGCVKIEGSQIGADNVVLDVNGVQVTITGWTEKEGGEEIGFTYTASGGAIVYAVKAGTETFESDTTTWVHPGEKAKGISNITFCVPDGDGGVPPVIDEGGEAGGDADGGTVIDEGGCGEPTNPVDEGGEEGSIDPPIEGTIEEGGACAISAECKPGLACVDNVCGTGIL
jgi:hypothetical protein